MTIFKDPIEEIEDIFSPKSLFLSIQKDIKRFLQLLP